MFSSKIALIVVMATVVCSLPLSEHGAHPREPGPQCDPGQEDDCSRCYDVLANQLIINDRNRFNLQNAFFPTETSNPVFVKVTYYFTRNLTGDGTTNYSLTTPNETWYWTQSTFYLFQPIETLQYTSLLFADSTLRKDEVFLYLQPNCQESDIAMMQLLTQRLKLYAMEQSIAAGIDDSYSAKGSNLETLKLFHEGKSVQEGEHLTRYTLSFQLIFPIVVVVFLVALAFHLIDNNDMFKLRREGSNPENLEQQPRENLEQQPRENLEQQPRENLEQQPRDNRNRNYNRLNDEDEKDVNIGDTRVSTQNMIIVITILCSFTFVLYVLVLDCIAVSYRHIRVDEVIFSNGPQSRNRTIFGDAVTLFDMEYSIAIIMFVYDIIALLVLPFFVGFVIWNKCGCYKTLNWFYVIIPPMFCIVNHSYHILVGFIHAPHHATSILIFYGIVVIVFIVTLRATYYNLHRCALKYCSCKNNGNNGKENRYKCPHSLVLCCMCLLSILIAGFLVYVTILFILVPINMAIDEAPDRLVSINQTALIFFGAAVTYKLYKDRKNGTVLDYLVKAQEKRLKEPNADTREKNEWEGLNTTNRKVNMATRLLNAIDHVGREPRNPEQ